jgi:hypothetical protein
MIHETGYWNKENAPMWHAHSQELNDWIINFLTPYKSDYIIDFGCGMGTYLKNLHENNFEKLMGLEGDPVKTDYDFEIKSQNLAEDFDLNLKGVVISLEVGEHIPKQYQDVFLNNIEKHCDNILIMSWAVRGQGGVGHFNEMNNDEIIPEIEKRGFMLLNEETENARQSIKSDCFYFQNTLLVFKKIKND